MIWRLSASARSRAALIPSRRTITASPIDAMRLISISTFRYPSPPAGAHRLIHGPSAGQPRDGAIQFAEALEVLLDVLGFAIRHSPEPLGQAPGDEHPHHVWVVRLRELVEQIGEQVGVIRTLDLRLWVDVSTDAGDTTAYHQPADRREHHCGQHGNKPSIWGHVVPPCTHHTGRSEQSPLTTLHSGIDAADPVRPPRYAILS